MNVYRGLPPFLLPAVSQVLRSLIPHDLDVWGATDLEVGGLGAGGLTEGGDTPFITDVPIWLFSSHQTPHDQLLSEDWDKKSSSSSSLWIWHSGF